VQIAAMMLSGGLCGLAGGVDYTGFIGQVGLGFSQNWGFLSIPVALLGGLHPLGVLVRCLFFGGLFAGSENLATFNTIGGTVVYVMQAVAVLAFVGTKSWLDSRKVRSEAL
jgi:simple sugar transport system permease protein